MHITMWGPSHYRTRLAYSNDEPHTFFVFLPHHFSLCHPKCQHILLALIHCMSAQSRKGEDQFDLYLTSGLGMSQNKIPKKTKCETLVDSVLNIKLCFSLSYSHLPLLARKHHLETFESRTAWLVMTWIELHTLITLLTKFLYGC